MANKLTKVPKIQDKGELFVNIVFEEKRPVLGMTMMKISGMYSLDALCKLSKKIPENNLLDELSKLQEEIRKCKSISDFLARFHTRHRQLHGNKIAK